VVWMTHNRKMDIYERFLNIKYEGARFSGGRLPLDVLTDLQALEDILMTFAREIWLKKHDRKRLPGGYADWFGIALTGVGDGSALPRLQLSVEESSQAQLIPSETRRELMRDAEKEFELVLAAASAGQDMVLSPAQIRNFNRFLTNLKPGEEFKYSAALSPIDSASANVISLDTERRKRFLTSVTTTYEQRVQGKARLKAVDETGGLRFIDTVLREFSVSDSTRPPSEYGANIGSYYEYDLVVVRKHDDTVQEVVTIHDLSLLEHPAIDAIDDMASLTDGWLDGYGRAVAEHIRIRAKDFIRSTEPLPTFYAVAPTEEGGVLLEFEAKGWDYGVEFNPDGSFKFFGIEIDGREECSLDFAPSNFQMLQERVKGTIKE
jgi:hypothetical protein